MLNKGWKMKTKIICPRCQGRGTVEGIYNSLLIRCPECNGEKTRIVEVSPEAINDFVERPEKLEFVCIGCGKREIILRPHPYQLPYSWIYWGDAFLCSECKGKIVLAAVIAINKEIERLKEKKNELQN